MVEILTIDDDPIQHEMLEAFFASSAKAQIVRAKSGPEAKALLVNGCNRFDLLVSDLHMPNFDGVELLRHLREIQCRSPILIASGAHRTVIMAATELAKAYGLNLIGSLTKPLSVPTLSASVAPWLAQHSRVVRS